MNYSDLPIEERIEKAAEYGLLLVADERPNVDVLSEMQKMFSLTREQAEQAYIVMREKHRPAFNNSVKTKIRNFWIIFSAALVMGIFYAGLGSELGWGFYLIAGFFGLALVGLFGNIIGLWFEKSVSARKFLSKSKSNVIIPADSKLNSIPAFFFFMLLITGIMAIVHYRVVNPDDLVRIDKLIVSEKVYYGSTGGKNRTYYYEFHFRDYPNEFRLEDNIYKYGKWKIHSDDFLAGDTISIEIKKKHLYRIREQVNPRRVYMVNLGIKENWLINHEERNRRIKWEDRMAVYVCGAGLILSIIGVRLWFRYKANKSQLLSDEFSQSQHK